VHLVKGASRRKRRAGKVFVHVLRNDLTFCLRPAIDRFPFVHPEMLQEFSAASHPRKSHNQNHSPLRPGGALRIKRTLTGRSARRKSELDW
jgi:hypothetical protein